MIKIKKIKQQSRKLIEIYLFCCLGPLAVHCFHDLMLKYFFLNIYIYILHDTKYQHSHYFRIQYINHSLMAIYIVKFEYWGTQTYVKKKKKLSDPATYGFQIFSSHKIQL